ncbi:centrosomal protein of 78 kDa-like isoform X1 [Tubulanus polymorphus]|uniref:centrosomal protein of 78 kDa-like isoform X1 n=2 Tax=Tubulanus polymorphus TaxID=672921 RepID=UPI003DA5056B
MLSRTMAISVIMSGPVKMTLIETVQVRQRGAYDYLSHYENLCALQDSCPLPAVKTHLNENVLDLNGDRVRATDWAPILNTVRINKTLEFIGIRSYFQQSLQQEDLDEKRSAIYRRKIPAIRSKEITYHVCKSLRECLNVTSNLICIELQGLPLRERDLISLSKGLAKSTCLRHLSVEYCNVGDTGLDILCKGIKNSVYIQSLNLTGCCLSWVGADALSKVIKHQAIKRHNEAWKDSLRYRRPNLDGMTGIRRITVNKNPLIGDQGAFSLAEALKDDLWLKALDLQQCGVTDTGAKALLQVLKYNTTMVVLDLRANPLVERETLSSLMEQVLINANGQDSEYKWIRIDSTQKPKPRTPAKKRLKAWTSKKSNIIKMTPSHPRKRSRTVGAGFGRTYAVSELAKPGMPWRTALRAARYRGYPPELTHATHERSDDESAPISHEREPPYISVTMDTSNESYERCFPQGIDSQVKNSDSNEVRLLKIELEQTRRLLKEERESQGHADQRIIDLTIENNRLRHEVDDLRRQGGATSGSSLFDDDNVLETVEKTFEKFHAFLDMLRDAGLGDLVALSGLANADNPIMPEAQPQTKILISANNNDHLEEEYVSRIADPTDTDYNPTTADELYNRIKARASAALAESRANQPITRQYRSVSPNRVVPLTVPTSHPTAKEDAKLKEDKLKISTDEIDVNAGGDTVRSKSGEVVMLDFDLDLADGDKEDDVQVFSPVKNKSTLSVVKPNPNEDSQKSATSVKTTKSDSSQPVTVLGHAQVLREKSPEIRPRSAEQNESKSEIFSEYSETFEISEEKPSSKIHTESSSSFHLSSPLMLASSATTTIPTLPAAVPKLVNSDEDDF